MCELASMYHCPNGTDGGGLVDDRTHIMYGDLQYCPLSNFDGDAMATMYSKQLASIGLPCPWGRVHTTWERNLGQHGAEGPTADAGSEADSMDDLRDDDMRQDRLHAGELNRGELTLEAPEDSVDDLGDVDLRQNRLHVGELSRGELTREVVEESATPLAFGVWAASRDIDALSSHAASSESESSLSTFLPPGANVHVKLLWFCTDGGGDECGMDNVVIEETKADPFVWYHKEKCFFHKLHLIVERQIHHMGQYWNKMLNMTHVWRSPGAERRKCFANSRSDLLQAVGGSSAQRRCTSYPRARTKRKLRMANLC